MMKNFFFILSFSRSGSTTLGQKLNNHSDVDVINESWIFNLLGVLKWKKLSPLRQKYILNQLNKEQKITTTNIFRRILVMLVSCPQRKIFVGSLRLHMTRIYILLPAINCLFEEE